MEATFSTKDLKSKLDRKENITVVETFAPERYREESELALLAMCSAKSGASTRKGNVRDGALDHVSAA
jgi:hypothetical protein